MTFTDTHPEGLKKLKKLKSKEYVFTSDEEGTSKEKAILNMEIYKTEKLLKSKLWDVPELDENDNSSKYDLCIYA